MIYGVGHDLLEIARIEELRARKSWMRFLERILTPNERQLATQRESRIAEYVAGRFAAKEAVVKALGCGIGEYVGFTDIEVLPDALGKPQCTVSAEAWERLGRINPQACAAVYRIHISITHQPTLASAFAVVEQID